MYTYLQSSIISLFIFLTYGTWVFFYFSIQYSPSECPSLFTRCQYDGLFGQTDEQSDDKKRRDKGKNKTYLCKSINKILSIVQETKLLLNIIHRMCSNFAKKNNTTRSAEEGEEVTENSHGTKVANFRFRLCSNNYCVYFLLLLFVIKIFLVSSR